MKINLVPDAIPISLWCWVCLVKDLLFPSYNLPKYEKNDDYDTIYGYSCRSLFEIWLNANVNQNTDNSKYGITPINHTSWRDIIQKYISYDTITVLELNDVKSAFDLDKVEASSLEKVRVVIITHLFGLDFDLSCLEEYKQKYNWLIVEDRVQGGTGHSPFSHSVVDMSFYSMGMDKRPCALGGGFVNIRKGNEEIRDTIIDGLNQLPQETFWSRCWGMIQKIPTYALYTYRPVYSFMSALLPLFGMTLSEAVQSYRKNNTGFTHHNYLLKPHPALQTSMYRNNLNYKEIEKRLKSKYSLFYRFINMEYIPWINYENEIEKGKTTSSRISLTMYNTIFFKPAIKEEKLSILDKFKVAYILNPTWKVLQVAAPNYQEFCDGIIYLPCLYHMSDDELQYLCLVINSK